MYIAEPDASILPAEPLKSGRPKNAAAGVGSFPRYRWPRAGCPLGPVRIIRVGSIARNGPTGPQAAPAKKSGEPRPGLGPEIAAAGCRSGPRRFADPVLHCAPSAVSRGRFGYRRWPHRSRLPSDSRRSAGQSADGSRSADARSTQPAGHRPLPAHRRSSGASARTSTSLAAQGPTGRAMCSCGVHGPSDRTHYSTCARRRLAQLAAVGRRSARVSFRLSQGSAVRREGTITHPSGRR